jgi:hypothetical protein
MALFMSPFWIVLKWDFPKKKAPEKLIQKNCQKSKRKRKLLEYQVIF